MEEKRKGTGQRPAPKSKDIITKVHNTCLFLFIIMMALVIAGHHTDNDRMLSAGVGIGVAVGMIEVIINTREDDEDE